MYTGSGGACQWGGDNAVYHCNGGVYLSPNQQSFEADYLRVAETTGGGIH